MKNQLLTVITAIFICCYLCGEITGQTPGNERKANNVTASPGVVSTAAPITKQNEFNWRGKIALGALVEIAAISGDIRIEIVEEGDMEVAAIKHGDEKEFDRVRIQVKESAGGIKVCAAYQAMEEQSKYECPALEVANPVQFDGNRQLRLGFENGKTQTFQLADVRAQLRVRIPRGARVAARTHTGNVEAEWLTKAAPAQTASFSSPIDLSSHIGNVSLTLSRSIDARVQMATASGAITTDFPVTVPAGFRGKGLEGTLGQGGPKIALGTHVGNVELRQAR